MKLKLRVLLTLLSLGQLLAAEKTGDTPLRPLDEESFVKAGFVRTEKADGRLEMKFRDKASLLKFFAEIGFEYDKQPYVRKGASIFDDRKVFNYRGFFFHAIEENGFGKHQDVKTAEPRSCSLVVKRISQDSEGR